MGEARRRRLAAAKMVRELDSPPNTSTSHYMNFRRWFVGPLESLYWHENNDAGFVIAMTVFPLLERYLRQKADIPEGSSLDSRFHDELVALFPEMRSRNYAKHIWHACRNGLLHQVTFNFTTSLSVGFDAVDPVIVIQGQSVRINPGLFARRVISAIENDFVTFEGGPPLPIILPIPNQARRTSDSLMGGTIRA